MQLKRRKGLGDGPDPVQTPNHPFMSESLDLQRLNSFMKRSEQTQKQIAKSRMMKSVNISAMPTSKISLLRNISQSME